jgi:dihydroorotate dehydrogenase (NAD+) catalytic subunit
MVFSTLLSNLGNVSFPNPLLLASGVVGNSFDELNNALNVGAGGVVTKSVGIRPRRGYPAPNIVKLELGVLNAVGLSNPGVDVFRSELSKNRKILQHMLVSIFGSRPQEYIKIIKKIDMLPFSGYELNLSCPHVKGVGTEIGHDPLLVSEIVKQVRKNTNKLLVVKLSPNTDKLVEIAKEAARSGADALTLVNTVRAIDIDIVSQKPSLTNIYGGLSGPAIKYIALRCVYELFEEVSIPLIGCGGISKWNDAIQFFLAGARLIEIGTSFIEDKTIFKKIAVGIDAYVQQKGLKSYSELIGSAH